MALDALLLEVLACPSEDHAPLVEGPDTLTCTACGRVYPVVDGIPVLLLDEATMPEAPAPGAPGPGASGLGASGPGASGPRADDPS